MTKRLRKRMYGVSLDRVGMIAGTMAFSRKAAIWHFLGHAHNPKDWEDCKASGYRTVIADVRVVSKPSRANQ